MKCKNWRRTPRMDRSLGCAKFASRAALHALCGPWWSSFGCIRLPSLPYHFQYPIPTITMKSDIQLPLFVWHFDWYIFQGQCDIAERSNWLWCFRISSSSILAEHFHPNLNKFQMSKAWKSQHAQPFDFPSNFSIDLLQFDRNFPRAKGYQHPTNDVFRAASAQQIRPTYPDPCEARWKLLSFVSMQKYVLWCVMFLSIRSIQLKSYKYHHGTTDWHSCNWNVPSFCSFEEAYMCCGL